MLVKIIEKINILAVIIQKFQLRKSLNKCGKGIMLYGKINVKSPNNIEIGNNVSLNDGVYLNGFSGIKIGDNCSLSANCMIISTGLDKEKLIKFGIKQHTKGNIIIGNNVQIGAGAIILQNVKIGDNTIIGAGSVVTKDIPSHSVAYGNPARVKKEGV